MTTVVAKKVGTGFLGEEKPGQRGTGIGCSVPGQDHLVWQPGTNMKQAPLVLKRGYAPTSLQRKCEGKGDREDGWRERTDNPGR